MANLFLRLSASFDCVPVNLAAGKKREIVLAHIVGEVHFEGERIGFSLKYKQKLKKDEPEKSKEELRLSSSFQVCLSLLFAYNTSINNQFLPLQNGLFRQCERMLFPFSLFRQV